MPINCGRNMMCGLVQGEYVLVCGPVDDELYEAAVAAEKEAVAKAGDNLLAVHRVGMRAARLQIDTLTAQINELDSRHTQLSQELEDQQLQSDLALEEARAEVQRLSSEIDQCRTIIRVLETERRRSLLSRHASERVMERMNSLTMENVVALVRLTSMVRGFLGRSRVKRIKTAHMAQEVGILSAMPNTVQGNST